VGETREDAGRLSGYRECKGSPLSLQWPYLSSLKLQIPIGDTCKGAFGDETKTGLPRKKGRERATRNSLFAWDTTNRGAECKHDRVVMTTNR